VGGQNWVLFNETGHQFTTFAAFYSDRASFNEEQQCGGGLSSNEGSSFK